MKKILFLLAIIALTSCSTQNLALDYANPSLDCENCDEID